MKKSIYTQDSDRLLRRAMDLYLFEYEGDISVQQLRKRLHVPYDRAVRLMDELEAYFGTDSEPAGAVSGDEKPETRSGFFARAIEWVREETRSIAREPQRFFYIANSVCFAVHFCCALLFSMRISGLYFVDLGFHLRSFQASLILFFGLFMPAALIYMADCTTSIPRFLAERLIPFEVVLLLVFAQYHFAIAVALAAIPVFCLVAGAMLDWDIISDLCAAKYSRHKLQQAFGDSNPTPWEVRRGCIRCAAVYATAMALLIPSIMALSVYRLDPPAYRPAVAAEALEDDMHSIAANWSIVRQLRSSAWNELDAEGRLNVLQAIANAETSRMGIEPVSVSAGMTGASGQSTVAGQYIVDKRHIVINLEDLQTMDSLSCLNVLLHECRHAYQHNVILMFGSEGGSSIGPLFDRARQWQYEFENPIDANVDYLGYTMQSTELDADDYAQKMTDMYKEYLYLYSEYLILTSEMI